MLARLDTRPLIVTSFYRSPGGVGSHVRLLSRELTRLGVRHDVVAEDLPEGVVLDGAEGVGAGSRWRTARAVWKAVRRSRPSVIHCHGSWYLLMACVASGTRIGCPVVFTQHTQWLSGDPRVRAWLLSIGLAFTHSLVFLSRDAEENFRRYVPTRGTRSIVLFSAVDDSGCQQTSAPSFDLASCMLLRYEEKRRGARDFIEIVSRLKALRGSVRGLFIGDDPIEPQLVALLEQSRQHGVEDDIVWAGFRENGAELLRDAAVYCHPTYRDNVPLSVAEALAASRPVVAYGVGGVPEMIRHGETGFVVETGDREAAARAIQSLLDDSAMYANFSAAARRSYEELFSPRRFARDHADLYARVSGRVNPEHRGER